MMMARALELARRAASIGEVPVGAVVYRSDGSVLAEAYNRREVDGDPSAHAEFIAMRAAALAIGDWRLSDCSLAVTLEPCPMCAGLVVNARVARVVYGAPDPKAGAVDTLFRLLDDARLNHRAQVISGVMAEDAAALLRAFFKTLRR
ncbi:MAG: nucleoside deaminase [Planctomycetota bacterium]|nr:nucleoside deaminase [Planctomycetota bacterium]